MDPIEEAKPTEPGTCLNCGVALRGEYCHDCGQRDIDPRASLWAVIGEFIQESLELDGRLPRTLVPFLFRPGFLAREFMEGRRRRYTSPVRLYVFAALVSFFMLQHAAAKAFEGGDVVVTNDGVKIDRSHSLAGQTDEPTMVVEGSGVDEELGREPETSMVPERYEGLTGDALLRTLIGDFFGWAPLGAAVLLFVYALLLELFHRRVPFLTHLVASTHVHAFALLALGGAAITQQMPALIIALALVQIYVLVGLIQTYGERWWKTSLKYCALTLIYWTAAIAVFTGVFLAATFLD